MELAQTYTPVDIMQDMWLRNIAANAVVAEAGSSDFYKSEQFTQVAIVNLVEDYGKKDYAFALYKEEWKLITSKDYMYNPAYVVVNARNRNNKILGIVKELKSTEEYGKNVTAQVGGVVNMDAYNAR